MLEGVWGGNAPIMNVGYEYFKNEKFNENLVKFWRCGKMQTLVDMSFTTK